MIKNKIKINNPLTLIAIFSMLTEASAAVSLPYIDSENQKIYVWFLIMFPAFLITLFFLTLNFNNKTLYTPADFSNGEDSSKAPAPSPPSSTDLSLNKLDSSTSLSARLIPSGIKRSSYTPGSFIFLPRGHRDYNIYLEPPPQTTDMHPDGGADHHVLVEGAEIKSLHIIDMSHPSLRLTHTLDHILRNYYKTTRKHKNSAHKKDVFLLLINPNSTLPSLLQKRSVSGHKHISPFDHATVITYNTETRELNVLNT